MSAVEIFARIFFAVGLVVLAVSIVWHYLRAETEHWREFKQRRREKDRA